jgi:hypothetical protein
VSTNYKEGNSIGYYRRSNPQDTVLVIFNSEHRDVEKSLRRWTFKDEELKDEIFENEPFLFEKTLILVNSDDWSRKEKNIKGIGVQIYTTGSCKDLIEKN